MMAAILYADILFIPADISKWVEQTAWWLPRCILTLFSLLDWHFTMLAFQSHR